jgi:hypothetical protein
MNRILAFMCGTLLLLTAFTPSHADAASCQSAITDFNSAQVAVAAAVTPYSNCIADNDGRESCAGTFGALQAAQQTFAEAVTRYSEQCE